MLRFQFFLGVGMPGVQLYTFGGILLVPFLFNYSRFYCCRVFLRFNVFFIKMNFFLHQLT